MTVAATTTSKGSSCDVDLVSPTTGLKQAMPVVDTSIPLTVTPASAVVKSTSHSSFRSARTAFSPSDSDTGTTNTSIQPSPEGPRGRHLKTSPGPLQLPEATLILPPSVLPTTTAMSEAVAIAKGPGLMRRLSGRASNKLARRRPSNSNFNRDRSSGPAIMRRRSNSQGGSGAGAGFETTQSPVDIDGDDEYEEGDDRLGLSNGACVGNGQNIFASSGPAGGNIGVGPVVPDLLQNGTMLTKVTRKKRKIRKFALDINSAKVYWDPSRPAKSFYIDDLREMRTGPDARNYREDFGISADVESNWITIIYADVANSKGRNSKTIHLIAPNQQIFRLWANTLESVSRYRIDMMASLANGGEKSIKAHWHKKMQKRFGDQPHSDADEKLNFEDVEDVCRSLHIDCPSSFLREQFDRADSTKDGHLDFAEFKLFVKHVKERKDVSAIFEKTAAHVEKGLEMKEFLNFVQEVQGIDVASNQLYWESIFERFARRARGSRSNSASPIEVEPVRMNLENFNAFLSSRQYNSPLKTVTQPFKLDASLSDYYISSSHNTYLLGRQVAGESSTEPYIRALQKGCRCVEVDCWDGSDGRPVVNHGRTLTTKVLFSDCITAIGKYAFVSTPYPLIISLEVHCGAEQQRVMADMLKAILGDKLISEPFMTNVFTLPSPEELKNRILIKVKASDEAEPVASPEEGSISRPHRAFSSPLSRPVVLDNSTVPVNPLASGLPSISHSERSSRSRVNSIGRSHVGGGTSMSTSSATDESDGRGSTGPHVRKQKKRKTSRIAKPLGDLGIYTCGHKYVNFNDAASRTFNHVFSFAERTFENVCKDAMSKAQLEQHNRRYLMRVYPSGYRIASSNFDPNKFWRRGAQMVALNWQTHDLGMQMNEAMFEAGTDKTGYVLKPQELRRGGTPLDEDDMDSTKKAKKLVKFSVDIISGQQLPRASGLSEDQSIAPYIEVETFCADDKAKGAAIGEGGQDASARNGMSGIGAPHRRRTRIVQTHGYNPEFNDKMAISVETKFPSLIFVRFTVRNSADGRTYGDRNGALASFTAKLESLQQGYHHLPLRDNNGEEYLFSTLFCRVQKEPIRSVTRYDGPVFPTSRFGVAVLSVFARSMVQQEKKGTPEKIEREGDRERDRNREQ